LVAATADEDADEPDDVVTLLGVDLDEGAADAGVTTDDVDAAADDDDDDEDDDDVVAGAGTERLAGTLARGTMGSSGLAAVGGGSVGGFGRTAVTAGVAVAGSAAVAVAVAGPD
jgi:hypothetical protein